MLFSSLLASCIAFAANRYSIEEDMILAIAYVESRFDSQAVNQNSDGSEDIGFMQVNSWWLTRFKDLGLRRSDLFEPCSNIMLGTWILRHSFDLYNDVWKAVGAYNAGTASDLETEVSRKNYAGKVAYVYQNRPWLH